MVLGGFTLLIMAAALCLERVNTDTRFIQAFGAFCLERWKGRKRGSDG